MSTEKRISFTGVDNGVSSQIEKLRRQTNDLGSDMIRQAREYSKSGREQVSFIEEQIRAIERRNRLDKEGQQMSAERQLQATGDKGAYQAQVSQIGLASREDDMQTKLLREVIETIKLTAREEIAEDRKDVEKQVSLLRSGKFEGTTEDELKVRYQEELLAKEKGDKGIMGDVFAGTFLANTLSQITQAISSFPSARNEEQVIGGMLSALPFGFGVMGGAYQRSTEEQLKAQVAQNRLGGLTGGSGRTPSMTRFGYDIGETAGAAEGAFRARGRANIDLEGLIGAQRAFSLDQGFMEQRVGLQRVSAGEQDFLDNMLEIFNGLTEDQRVIFSEVAQNQASLVEEFSQSTQSVNQSMVTDLMMRFDQLGGAFSLEDPRSLQRIQTLNQSLANPSTDIMQAENLSLLRSQNPNAGIFDILEKQSQGLQNPELLGGIMGNIRSRYGGDDQMGMLALQRRTGMDFSSTRQLYENFDRFQAEGLSGEEMMTRSGVIEEGRMRTAGLEQSQAQIANAFVKGSLDGMLEVADLVGGRIADYIKRAFSDGEVTDKERKEMTKEEFEARYKAYSEN